ncbi:MAG: hypothetical protein MZV49_11350 [Rhodopseudomonas palustris]|nr:hypothetical protein [Rhodopseudomonas palustris]
MYSEPKKRFWYLLSTGDDQEFKPGVYSYSLQDENLNPLIDGKGKYKQLSVNKTASKIAFVADTSDNKKMISDCLLWSSTEMASLLVNADSEDIPDRNENQ